MYASEKACSLLTVINKGRPCRLNCLLWTLPTWFLKSNCNGNINQHNNNNNISYDNNNNDSNNKDNNNSNDITIRLK